MGFHTNAYNDFSDWFFSWSAIFTIFVLLLVCYGIVKYTTGRRDDDRNARHERLRKLEEEELKIDDPSLYDDFQMQPSREDIQQELRKEQDEKIEEANETDFEAYMMEEQTKEER